MSVCLKSDVARRMPEKLSNNEHGAKDGEPRGSPFFNGAFSGQERGDDR
ncbi:hypothetical protein ABIA54_001398 [Pseudomonas sp. EB276 TE3739]|nr:hypothetical protein [Pseudomonas koreensis]